MVKPQEVLLQCRSGSANRPGICAIYMNPEARIAPLSGHPVISFGRCADGWKELSDEQVYQALNIAVLEMVEFHGVPIRFARDCLQDNVEGYREWLADNLRFQSKPVDIKYRISDYRAG